MLADSITGPQEPWYGALLRSVGYGVQAAGKAASEEGTKAGNADLQTGGNIVSSLSAMLTGGMNQPQSTVVADAGIDPALVILTVGAVGVGGYVLWKLFHK